METPNVPGLIKAPAGEKLVLMARAAGFQVYICRPDAAGKPAWTLKAPEAELMDDQGNVIGKHFGGPTWQHNDGSQIVGKMTAKADPPNPGPIPWLLLTATDHIGNGLFSDITSVQRINTVGGMPPGSGCTDAGLETEFKSRYTADYYFYAKE